MSLEHRVIKSALKYGARKFDPQAALAAKQALLLFKELRAKLSSLDAEADPKMFLRAVEQVQAERRALVSQFKDPNLKIPTATGQRMYPRMILREVGQFLAKAAQFAGAGNSSHAKLMVGQANGSLGSAINGLGRLMSR